jgi:hypothetical protein
MKDAQFARGIADIPNPLEIAHDQPIGDSRWGRRKAMAFKIQGLRDHQRPDAQRQ